jgi:hypothetical protein
MDADFSKAFKTVSSGPAGISNWWSGKPFGWLWGFDLPVAEGTS